MDRRSFIRTSCLVGAAAALAPQKLIDGAFAATNTVPLDSSSLHTSAMIRRFIENGIKPSEIAYCCQKKARVNAIASDLFGSHENWPPYFRTLSGICYRHIVRKKNLNLRLMTSCDYKQFLDSTPDPQVTAEKIRKHNRKIMLCRSPVALDVVERLLDPGKPLSCGHKMDEVDLYEAYRYQTGLISNMDLLVIGAYSEEAIEGIRVAVFQGENSPLWDAAAINLFRKAKFKIFLRRDH
jgi:hypothetical protein